MTNLLLSLGITRDSVLWLVGKIVAVIMAAAGLLATGGHLPGIPSSWSPYILLAAFIIGGGSAQYSTSSLPGKKMAWLLPFLLTGAVLSGAACHIQLTPSLIASLLTTLQTEVNQLPAGEVPPAVTDALTVAVQSATADASGKSWADIARQALTTVYSDLPVKDQSNPYISVTIAGLEAALAAVGA